MGTFNLEESARVKRSNLSLSLIFVVLKNKSHQNEAELGDKRVLYFGLQGLASDEKMASSNTNNQNSVNQFIGQRLYKHDGKLSKRAQEVTGIPLINYNLLPVKEPLKRTFSAAAATTGSGDEERLLPTDLLKEESETESENEQ